MEKREVNYGNKVSRQVTGSERHVKSVRPSERQEGGGRECGCGRENLLSHGEHLLFAVLVVVHLGTVSQSFVPELRTGQKEVVVTHRTATCSSLQNKK